MLRFLNNLLYYSVENIDRDFKRPSDEEVFDTIGVIRRIYPQIENEIRELTQRNKFYSEEIGKATDIKSEKKIGHLIQLGSIIGKKFNLIVYERFPFRPSRGI